MAEIAAIILAAGRASRFGADPGDSKVVALVDGMPMVRRVAKTALASRAASVFVVVGNAGDAVAKTLDGLPVCLVSNPDWASGMASSLRAGIAAPASSVTGVLVLLADMPFVRVETLDALILAFAGDIEAVIPVNDRRRGNPVLLGRALFGEIAKTTGDEGARTILGRPGRRVGLCSVNDPGIAIDLDTREDVAIHRGSG